MQSSKIKRRPASEKTLKKLETMIEEIGPETLLDSIEEYESTEDCFENCKTAEDVDARKKFLKSILPCNVDCAFKVWMNLISVEAAKTEFSELIFYDNIFEALSNSEMAEFENLWSVESPVKLECFSKMQPYRQATIDYLSSQIDRFSSSHN